MSPQPFVVGQEVNIVRSSGLQQRVQISQIKDENATLVVEWIEANECKGKEVSTSQLIAWNSSLTPNLKPQVINQRKALNRKTIFGGSLTVNAQPPVANEKMPPRKSFSANVLKRDENAGHLRLDTAKRKMSILDRRAPKLKNRSGQELSRCNSGAMPPQNVDFIEMIQNYRVDLHPRPLTPSDKIKSETRIVVCVRKRPLNSREQTKADIDIVSIPDPRSVLVHECKLKVDLTKYLDHHRFQFDYVFGENTTNDTVYCFAAEPLIDCVFTGGHATCFAYGQTGSGKTYTISGDTETRGIYDFAINDIFERLRKPKCCTLKPFISLFEIYKGKVFDLLNKRKMLRMLEDAHSQIQICELVETPVSSADSALDIIQGGLRYRSSGQTSANPNSSRSHAILQLTLKKPQGRGGKLGLFGKLSMIDLAGNERGADTTTCDRQTRLEGAEINKSLLALKECIRALCRRGAHLPFRASKLTQVLRDSFISERSRTCMIATVSPGVSCCENTLNTLRYTDRVKEIESDKRAEAPTSPSPANALKLICSKNDLLYNFHKTVANIFSSEEELYAEHKKVVSAYPEWHNVEEELLRSIENGDQNIDHYVAALEVVVAERVSAFQTLKDKLIEVKAQLCEEELASKRVKHLPTF